MVVVRNEGFLYSLVMEKGLFHTSRGVRVQFGGWSKTEFCLPYSGGGGGGAAVGRGWGTICRGLWEEVGFFFKHHNSFFFSYALPPLVDFTHETTANEN